MPKLTKQKHCYGSIDFWKSMYEKPQAIIQKSYEKTLKECSDETLSIFWKIMYMKN